MATILERNGRKPSRGLKKCDNGIYGPAVFIRGVLWCSLSVVVWHSVPNLSEIGTRRLSNGNSEENIVVDVQPPSKTCITSKAQACQLTIVCPYSTNIQQALIPVFQGALTLPPSFTKPHSLLQTSTNQKRKQPRDSTQSQTTKIGTTSAH